MKLIMVIFTQQMKIIPEKIRCFFLLFGVAGALEIKQVIHQLEGQPFHPLIQKASSVLVPGIWTLLRLSLEVVVDPLLFVRITWAKVLTKARVITICGSGWNHCKSLPHSIQWLNEVTWKKGVSGFEGLEGSSGRPGLVS